MIQKTLLSLPIVLIFLGCHSSEPSKPVDDTSSLVKEAQLAFDSMADTTALELSQKACNLESADGCFLEGEIYRLGRGVQKDSSKAISLYEKAAKIGSISAQYKLGKMYYLGKGVTANSKKAISYLEKAALKGDLNSIKFLVFIYETSEELLKDNQKSLELWKTKLPAEVEAQSIPIYSSSAEWSIGAEVKTVGGTFKMFYDDRNVMLDNNLIDKLDSEHEYIDKNYAFKDKNIILVCRSSGYNVPGYEKYYMYTILKDKTVKKTPILPMGHVYQQFADDEIIILKIKNEQGIDKTVLYEDGIIKVDGKTIAEAGIEPQSLVMSDQWKPKFKQLLGKKYQTFEDNLDMPFENTTLNGSYIVGSGGKKHSVFNDQAIFAIDFKNFPSSLKIYVVLKEDGKISKYGFQSWEEVAPMLKEWAQNS